MNHETQAKSGILVAKPSGVQPDQDTMSGIIGFWSIDHLIDQGRRLPVQVGSVAPGHVGPLGQAADHIMPGEPTQRGQEVMAHTGTQGEVIRQGMISRVPVSIGGVIPPGESLLQADLRGILPGHTKEGPKILQSAPIHPDIHTGDCIQTPGTNQSDERGLGLVIHGMGQEDDRSIDLPGLFPQGLVSGLAGIGLQTRAGTGHMDGPDPYGVQPHTPAISCSLETDPIGVLGQPMVNQHGPTAKPQHGRDLRGDRCQGHGVTPTGAGHQNEGRIRIGAMSAVSGKSAILPPQTGILKAGTQGSYGLLHLRGIDHKTPTPSD